MNENTAIVLNLQSPNISTVVYAVQNDRLSRHITAQLLDGAAPWTPPAGASAAIRYLKPDGTAGFYDVDEDGNDAITISGSVATLTIAEQALTVPGDVYMQLNFYTTDEERLTTFSWLLRVQKSVIEDAEIVSSDYFNALTEKIAQGIEVAQRLTYPVPIYNGGTNAADAVAALLNLQGYDLTKGTEIPDNSDLNNYTTPGVYYVSSATHAATILNTPITNSGFRLIVQSDALTGFFHHWMLPNNSKDFLARVKNTSTWSAWAYYLNSDILPLSLQNGGTGGNSALTATQNLGFSVITGTSTTSANGVATLGDSSYDVTTYMCLSVVATGAVSNYVLIPYKYGNAANGRWGFAAVIRGTLEPIANTEIAYAAVMFKYA